MNIEIRERSFFRYPWGLHGKTRDDAKYLHMFVVVADGRRVDSFLYRENAEKKVAKLKAEAAKQA